MLDASRFDNLFQLFAQGGLMMWPLLALSVTAMALVLEQLFSLRISRIAPPDGLSSLLRKLRAGALSTPDYQNLLSEGEIGRLLYRLLKEPLDLESAEKIVLMEGQALQLRQQRWNQLLGTVAVTSPLLGLLGTVLGMMTVFQSLSLQNGDHQLASGLSVALITTAYGLIIAIPSTFMHRVFAQRQSQIMTEYYHLSQLCLDTLFAKSSRQAA